jgi:hypothetical protein
MLKKLTKDQNGSAIPLVGLSLIVLLALTGFALDMGTLIGAKMHLQKAANAAVLSGAQELTNNETAVRNVVNTVLEHHDEGGNVTALNVEMERNVAVDLSREVPLAFSSLLGRETAFVEVHAAAEIMTMAHAAGAAPLGIPDSVTLEYYKEYKLKVDETDVDTGNFGVLALGGTGAQTYETNLKYGFQNPIKVGDIIGTQTGNIAGKTKTGIQDRLNRCPYLAGETHHRSCPRILLIPVYRPYTVKESQVQQVEITGFAYFYISAPMNDRDKTISGMFIKRAGTGFVDPNIVNTGAYSIKLTE